MTLIISCSWCHAPNDLAHTMWCHECGHRADRARAECNCPQCLRLPAIIRLIEEQQ